MDRRGRGRGARWRARPALRHGGIVPTRGAVATALQSDGKMVVVGEHIARHHVDGSLDQTLVPAASWTMAAARRSVVQPDGKILVTAGPGGTRPKATLTPLPQRWLVDTGFGTAGHVTTDVTDLGSSVAAAGIALDRAGQIVLVFPGVGPRIRCRATTPTGASIRASVPAAGSGPTRAPTLRTGGRGSRSTRRPRSSPRARRQSSV